MSVSEHLRSLLLMEISLNKTQLLSVSLFNRLAEKVFPRSFPISVERQFG